MSGKIDLSETDKKFVLASSLLDTPYSEENSLIRVCVFYLSKNGKPGGDTFRIRGDSRIAISLMGDLSEEDEAARRCFAPLMGDLEKITEIGASNSFNTGDITKTILKIDQKLPFPTAMALSFVRLSQDRKMQYLNIGENILLATYNNQRIEDLSGLETGKVGWFKCMPEADKESLIKGPYEMSLVPSSRILIFTDGVRDYLRGNTPVKSREDEIKKALIYAPTLSDCIRKINTCASDKLLSIGEKLSDDYTMIGIEIK